MDDLAGGFSKYADEIKALTGFDIMVDDETFKNIYEIFDGLSAVWDDLSDTVQSRVSEILGGTRQLQVISSIMNNWSDAAGAYEDAMDSAGVALNSNAIYMETIEAKTAQFSASVQELANDAISSDLIKSFVDFGTQAVNALDSVISSVGMLGTVFAGLTITVVVKRIISSFKALKAAANFSELSNMQKVLKTLQGAFPGVTNAVKTFTSSLQSGQGVIKSFSAAMTALNPVMLAVTAAVAAAVAALVAFNKTQHSYTRAIESAQDLADAYKETKSELDDLQAQYDEQMETIEELNALKTDGSITTEQEIELQNLLDQNEQLERQLAIKQQLADIEQQEATQGAIEAATSEESYLEYMQEQLGPVKGFLKALNDYIANIFTLGNSEVSFFGNNNVSEWNSQDTTDVGRINTEIANIQAYQAEIDAIEEQLVNDPTNQKLMQQQAELESKIATSQSNIATATSNIDSYYDMFFDSSGEIIEGCEDIVAGIDEAFDNYATLDMDDLGRQMYYIENFFGKEENNQLSATLLEATKSGEDLEEILDGVLYSLDAIGSGVEMENVERYFQDLADETKEYDEILKSFSNGILGSGTLNEPNISEAFSRDPKEIFDEWISSLSEEELSAVYDVVVNPEIDTSQWSLDDWFDAFNVELKSQMANTDYSAEFNEWLDSLSSGQQKAVFDISVNPEFNTDDWNLDDWQEALEDAFKVSDYLDEDFLEVIDDYQDGVTDLIDTLDKFRSGNFSNSDLLDLYKKFPQLADSTDDLDGAIVDLINDMNTDMVDKFADQFGDIDSASEDDIAALEAFEDAVLSLGEVVGSTEFEIDIDAETNGIDNLLTAMKESVSATGLTADSVSNLKARYQDLENYDAAKLFEKTANGIHLNTKELRELESAYEKQTKAANDAKLDDLVKQYNDLTEQINNCTDASERADLYAQRSNVLDKINDTAELAAEYEGLTSAYSKWEQAQSIGEEGDMYDNLAGSLEDIGQLYEDGLIGTNKFRTAVQLMSNEDLTNASAEELMRVYEESYPLMERYFTDSSDGCLNFLNDLQDLNSEWVHMNEDGSWEINFGMGNDQEIADALGLNVETVQTILRKLSDYGFEINLDSVYTDLGLLQTDLEVLMDNADDAVDALKKLDMLDVDFDLETGDLEENIATVQELYNSLLDENGEIDLSVDGAEETMDLLLGLIAQKQLLSEPAIMTIDTSTFAESEAEIADAIDLMQDFVSLSEELEMETALGVDTTETQQKLQEVATQLESIDDSDLWVSLGVDEEALDETLESITNTEVDIETGAIVNQDDIDAIIDTLNGIDVEDIELMTNSEDILSELGSINSYTIEDKDFTVTAETATANSRLITVKNNLDNLKDKTITVTTNNVTVNSTVNKSSSSSGTSRVSGTAHVAGTAFKSGNWGTSGSGTALVGELGTEVLVRDGKFYTVGDSGAEFIQYKKGDIIFDAQQTAALLSKGKITGSNNRGSVFADGTAFVEGTAFSSGVGTIYGSGTVKTTASSSSKSSSSSSSSKSSSSSSSSSAEETVETIDWIEIAIDRLERAIDSLSKTATSTYKTLSKRLSASADEISKVTDEIALQQQAYDRYIEEANSVGLSSSLAKKVREGTIDISEYDEDTADLIELYQQWYEKALDCADAIDDLHESLASLYEDNFNNIQNDYDNQLALLEHLSNTYETGISSLEARGYMESTKYYSALQDVTRDSISIMESELDDLSQALQDALDSGEIEKYSESW